VRCVGVQTFDWIKQQIEKECKAKGVAISQFASSQVTPYPTLPYPTLPYPTLPA
jgi:hypothetical protein